MAIRGTPEDPVRDRPLPAAARSALRALLDNPTTAGSAFKALTMAIVPSLADSFTVALQRDDELVRAHVAHHDPTLERLLSAQEHVIPPPILREAFDWVLREGKTIILENLAAEYTRGWEVPAALVARAAQLRPTSMCLLPLQSDGQVFGLIALVLDESSGRRFEEAMLGDLEDLAATSALILHTVELQRRARDAAAQSDSARVLLETVLHETPLGIAFLDRELRFTRINEALAEINGTTVEDALGRHVREVVPELADLVVPHMQRVLATGTPVANFEVTGETPADPGVQRHWSTSIVPVRGAEGIEGLATFTVEVTEQRLAERALEDRLAGEALLRGVSTRLLHTPEGALDEAVNAVLRDVAQRFDADRVSSFRIDRSANAWLNTHEWSAPTAPSLVGEHVGVDDDGKPALYRPLGRFETVRVDDTETLPAAHGDARSRLERRGIRALLMAPKILAGALSGFISVERLRTPRRWSDADARLLQSVAALVAQAEARADALNRLRADLEERERIQADLARRVAQQAAVAQLGRQGLEDPDLDEVLALAVRTAAQGLDLPLGKLLELAPAGDRFVLRAGHGWQGLRIPAPVEWRADSPAGLVASTGDPVLCEDCAQERRFSIPPLLQEHDVTALAYVPIGGRQKLFGVLAVHAREPRHFSADDVAFLRAVANVVASAVVRHETERQLLHAQKLEAVARLSGGLAHDFNNLLSVVLGHCDLLEARLEGGEREEVTIIRQATERAAALTKRVLSYSRERSANRRPLDLGLAVLALRPMLDTLMGERVTLDIHAQEEVITSIDAGQLEQVLLNLVINARDAMPSGGHLTIAIQRTDANRARVAVSDTGMGMDADTRSRALEPFFTTKDEGKGTGLGLSTIADIVHAVGGEVEIDSEPGAGTTVAIELPTDTMPAPRRARPAARPVAGGQERVLVVEDQTELRDIVTQALRSSGYEVRTASSAAEVRAQLAEEPRVDLLVTDVVMPDTTGPEIAAQVRTAASDSRVLYMSGYAVGDQLPADAPRNGYLQKPFGVRELLRAVRGALDG